MVLTEAGALNINGSISLWGIPELRGVTVTDGAVSIGAMTTYTDLMRHQVVRSEFPLLVEAAYPQTGGVATQNRGTVGGNIANGSPAADTPPAPPSRRTRADLGSRCQKKSRTIGSTPVTRRASLPPTR